MLSAIDRYKQLTIELYYQGWYSACLLKGPINVIITEMCMDGFVEASLRAEVFNELRAKELNEAPIEKPNIKLDI